MKTMKLEFISPMQSYGTGRSKTEQHRDTNNFPLKSAIVGLLLNALGHDKYNPYYTDAPRKLSDAIRVGIIDNSYTRYGRYNLKHYTDFQIAHRNDKDSNDVLYKDYLINAKFVVFVEGEDETIDTLYPAIKNPKRLLFLGRKCNIPNYKTFTDTSITDGSLEDSICTYFNSSTRDSLPSIYIESKNHNKPIPTSFTEFLQNKFQLDHEIIPIYGGYSLGDVISFIPKVHRTFYYYAIIPD